MSEQLPNQEVPKGGVDLGSPIMVTLREFGKDVVTNDMQAVVLIGMTKQGGVAARTIAPGGAVQILGMIEFAKATILDQLKAPRQQP